jgi:hypothetical protein
MDIDELHLNETRELIFHDTAWVAGLGAQADQFSQWEAERKIFSVVYNGDKYYASYQFGDDGGPLPVVREVLQHLNSKDPWAIAAWFHCKREIHPTTAVIASRTG